MTIFDYAVLAISGASLLIGLWRGVVSEILALAAWIAAFFAARAVAADVGSAAGQWIHDPAMQYLIGFAAIFIGVLIVFAIVRFALRRLLSAAGLGAVDRVLGGVFGLARAALIVMALVLVGGLTAAPRQKWWLEAQLAPPLETAAIALKPWLPQSVAKRIKYR